MGGENAQMKINDKYRNEKKYLIFLKASPLARKPFRVALTLKTTPPPIFHDTVL
jgi:hypothetical protein